MPTWIELDGVVNLRDVSPVPVDGATRTLRAGTLLRSDNLQDLSSADVTSLRLLGLTDVVDLRSSVEVASTGPGPLDSEPWVRVHHLSLLPEQAEEPATARAEAAQDVVPGDADELPAGALPWVGLRPSADHDDPAVAHYLSYLQDRPESVVQALRVIARAEGATLVHCAAGKDRTGTVVALALLLAGVSAQDIVADYTLSAERIDLILQRLLATATYAAALGAMPVAAHTPLAQTMAAVVATLAPGGGTGPLREYLARHGWSEQDTAALRTKLVD